jgi:hypothetical protein
MTEPPAVLTDTWLAAVIAIALKPSVAKDRKGSRVRVQALS